MGRLEWVKKILRKIYSCRTMIGPGEAVGEIPTSASLYKRTLSLAWPAAVESVLVSLVSSIDTMMVGSLGAPAIAAVGITNQPKFILLAVIFSLNTGVTAIVARRKGEGDIEGANRCLRQCVMISGVLSLLLSLFGFFFAEPLMIFAGAQEDVVDLATGYFQVLMTSIVFTSLSLTINAAQRGSGNTRISMKTNVAANVVNLIFNYLLIGGNFGFPAWGVRGAAAATAIGNLVAFLMSLRSVSKKSGFLHISFHASWAFDRKTIGTLVSISGSALVEQICMRIGFFSYVKIVAGLGTTAFATHQICMNIINLSFGFGDGFGVSASALVGQSLGAKRPDLAVIYGKCCQRITFTISCGLSLFFFFGRRFLMTLFTSDADIIAMGSILILFIAVITFGQTSQVTYTGALRGAGDAKYIAVISFVSIMVIRPATAWLLCYPLGFGLIGAWVSLLTDQYLRLFLSMRRFAKGKWKNIKV